MASYSITVIMGNITKDPVLSATSKGTSVCQINVAVNRKYSTGDEQKKEEVLFMPVVIWGKTAEAVNKYLKKGDPIFIEGYLKQDNWVDKQNNKRTAIKLVATRVQFINGKKPEGQTQDAPAGSENQETQEEESIPF